MDSVCDYCLKDYDSEVNIPLFLKCGNTCCVSCLTYLGLSNRNFYKCPMCKQNCSVLNIDRNILDNLSTFTCILHDLPLDSYCQEDNIFVCRDCKTHENHNKISKSRVTNVNKEEVNHKLSSLMSDILEESYFDKVISELKNCIGVVKNNEKEFSDKIHKFYKEFTLSFKNLIIKTQNLKKQFIKDCRGEEFKSNLINFIQKKKKLLSKVIPSLENLKNFDLKKLDLKKFELDPNPEQTVQVFKKMKLEISILEEINRWNDYVDYEGVLPLFNKIRKGIGFKKWSKPKSKTLQIISMIEQPLEFQGFGFTRPISPNTTGILKNIKIYFHDEIQSRLELLYEVDEKINIEYEQNNYTYHYKFNSSFFLMPRSSYLFCYTYKGDPTYYGIFRLDFANIKVLKNRNQKIKSFKISQLFELSPFDQGQVLYLLLKKP